MLGREAGEGCSGIKTQSVEAETLNRAAKYYFSTPEHFLKT